MTKEIEERWTVVWREWVKASRKGQMPKDLENALINFRNQMLINKKRG